MTYVTVLHTASGGAIVEPSGLMDETEDVAAQSAWTLIAWAFVASSVSWIVLLRDWMLLNFVVGCT
jgi:hypothetical protein